MNSQTQHYFVCFEANLRLNLTEFYEQLFQTVTANFQDVIGRAGQSWLTFTSYCGSIRAAGGADDCSEYIRGPAQICSRDLPALDSLYRLFQHPASYLPGARIAVALRC